MQHKKGNRHLSPWAIVTCVIWVSSWKWIIRNLSCHHIEQDLHLLVNGDLAIAARVSNRSRLLVQMQLVHEDKHTSFQWGYRGAPNQNLPRLDWAQSSMIHSKYKHHSVLRSAHRNRMHKGFATEINHHEWNLDRMCIRWGIHQRHPPPCPQIGKDNGTK